MLQKQYPFFFIAPINFLNAGVQMVVPPLTTLLALTTWQLSCDRSPSHGSMLVHHLEDFLVLLLRPRSFDRLNLISIGRLPA